MVQSGRVLEPLIVGKPPVGVDGVTLVIVVGMVSVLTVVDVVPMVGAVVPIVVVTGVSVVGNMEVVVPITGTGWVTDVDVAPVVPPVLIVVMLVVVVVVVAPVTGLNDEIVEVVFDVWHEASHAMTANSMNSLSLIILFIVPCWYAECKLDLSYKPSFLVLIVDLGFSRASFAPANQTFLNSYTPHNLYIALIVNIPSLFRAIL